jgi:hypothetical protein
MPATNKLYQIYINPQSYKLVVIHFAVSAMQSTQLGLRMPGVQTAANVRICN